MSTPSPPPDVTPTPAVTIDRIPAAPAPPPRYDAFISYSRAKDEAVASALRRGLHRFAKPWYRLRALRIFRDDSNLTANSSLWGSVEEALSASRFFILLASAQAVASEWVDREVSYWLERHGAQTLLIVLTDPVRPGEIDGRAAWSTTTGDFDRERSSAIPASLRTKLDSEPRFVDLGWARERSELDLKDTRFTEAVADLAAPIRGQDKSDLLGEDVKQYKRTRRLAQSAVSLILLLAVASSAAAVVAVNERDDAQTRALIAEARQYSAESQIADDPDEALALAIAAEAHTSTPLPEARQAFVSAGQRAEHWTSRLIARFTAFLSGNLMWSADGSSVIATSSDGSTSSWRIADGQIVPGLPASPIKLIVGSWSANRRTMAWSTEDGGVVVFDVLSGTRDGPFPVPDVHPGTIVDETAPSPDGTVVAARVSDGALVLLSATTGAVRKRDLHGPGGLGSTSWSPDGHHIAVVADNGMRIWDTSTFGFVDIPAVGGAVTAMSWAPSSDKIAVGRSDGSLAIVDPQTGLALGRSIPGHRQPVNDVSWSPDGSRIASSAFDGKLQIWTLATGTQLTISLGSAGGMAWSPDGSLLAAAFGDEAKVPRGGSRVIRILEFPDHPIGVRAFAGATGPVASTDWSPTGKTIAALAGDNDTTPYVWDADTAALHERHGGTDQVTSPNPGLAWSPDGSHLAAVGGAGLRVWSANALDADARPLYGSGGATSLAWSPDSTRLATGDDGGSIRIWDVRSGRPTGMTFAQGPAAYGTGAVLWIAWSDDGRWLGSASADGRVRRWDVPTGQPVGESVRGPGPEVTAVAWSGRGDRVAVGALGGSIGIYPADGKHGPPVRLQSSNENATALAWSPDGTRLAVAGTGGVVEIWDTADGAMLGRVTGPAQVNAVSWSPDGSELVSGGQDSAVTLWTSISEAAACDAVQKELRLTYQLDSDVRLGLTACAEKTFPRGLPLVPVN